LGNFRRGTLYAFVGDQYPAENSEPKLNFRVGDAVNMPTTQHCNFAGDDCWTVRTHPKIDGLSANSGYTTGSHELTISGYGLNGTDVSVVVDGVDCNVKSSQSESIVCETQAGAESVAMQQPGQLGVKREFYNPADAGSYPSLTSIIDGTANLINSTLYTSLESYDGVMHDEDDKSG